MVVFFVVSGPGNMGCRMLTFCNICYAANAMLTPWGWVGFVLAMLTFGNTCHVVDATLTTWERWGCDVLFLLDI